MKFRKAVFFFFLGGNEDEGAVCFFSNMFINIYIYIYIRYINKGEVEGAVCCII